MVIKILMLTYIMLVSIPAFSTILCSDSFDRTRAIQLEGSWHKTMQIDNDATARILFSNDNFVEVSLNVYGEREEESANLDGSNILYVELFGRSILCWNQKDTDSEVNSSHALVVVDMQASFFEQQGNQIAQVTKDNLYSLHRNILKAIEIAKEKGTHIIFIEYAGHGSTIEVFKDAVANYEKVAFFTKNTDGMFEKPNKSKDEILSYLINNQIQSLVFAGLNGGACVFASIFDSLRYFSKTHSFNRGIADLTGPEFIYPYDYNNDLFDDILFFDPPRIGRFGEIENLLELKKVWSE